MMATATSEKINYPVINASVWRVLRKKFQDNPPKGAITPSYLSSVLSYKKEAASSLIGQLKRVGLIDAEGKLTERAFQWRTDAQYRTACKEIIDEVYPQEVRDLFHTADASRDEVERWFASNTKSGTGTAANYARFYLMLLDGDPSNLEVKSTPKPGTSGNGSKKPRAARTKDSSRGTASESAHANSAKANGGAQDEQPPTSTNGNNGRYGWAPTLHLDFQIHIAPDLSPEQIDHVFESMAKHLQTLFGEVKA